MKFTAVASLAIVSVSANDALFDEFPEDCTTLACATDFGFVCCKFTDGEDSSFKRCMSDA